MKKMTHLMTCAVVAAMSMEVAKAALNIPSNGTDGDLVVTNNLEIDLSRATPGNWDDDNSANAGNGIYDASKWAVVFHYRSVIVQGGATVTFKNHAKRAPVVWLVQSNVTVNGTVSLDGQGSQLSPWLAEPGPGGFRGGSGYYASGAGSSAGFGPGGGPFDSWSGIGGGYGTVAPYPVNKGQTNYGNVSLIPLIGGAGGGGSANGMNFGGGAGGGAILIACRENLSVTGTIRANGSQTQYGGGGSGGGIRLVADTFAGSGLIEAVCRPGNGPYGGTANAVGGQGRIRIERVTNAFTPLPIPQPSVVELGSGATPVIWLPTNGPTVSIVSIDGNAAPADPRAEFGAFGADVVLPQITNVTVVVLTTNVEPASVVIVRATPRSDGSFRQATAAVTEIVSEVPQVVRWTANVPVQNGYAAIQVKVVRP